MITIARLRPGRIASFVQRQKRNYRVAVVRAAATRFLIELTQAYTSIYTVALGANSVQLGTVNSIGSAISSLIATPAGWLMDRYGIKFFYLLAIALMGGNALIFGLAQDWHAIIAATILASVAMSLTGTGCSVICADSVRNRDRVTAQNVCVTVSSIAAMLSPIVAAQLVTIFGGINVAGIRPLYYIRFAGYGFIFLFVAFFLTEPRGGAVGRRQEGPGFVASFRELWHSYTGLPKWIALSSLMSLPMAMTMPFFQLYAHEFKGANQYVLGAMATAAVVARLLFGIPLGRLADRIGRKRLIYWITPLWYASYLLLIFAKGPLMLLLAGALQTFYMICSGATAAMMIELVSLEHQGRWSGLLGLFRGLATIPAPVIGGLIWRELGAAYVFLIPIALDLLFRVPLMALVSETLHRREEAQE